MGREDRHPVGEIRGLADVVGDEEDRLACLLPDLLQLFVQDVAGLRIERCEGFVHEQDLGVHGERSSDRYSLAHAAR